MGALVYLLSAPLVWQHYLVLALVPALALAGAPGRGRVVPWFVALALSTVAIDPWTDLLQLRSLATQAMLATGGLAALWMLSLWEASRR